MTVTPHMFPNIFVCPQPGYNMDALHFHGYSTPFWYYNGIDKHFTFIGWNGNRGRTHTNVSESLLTLTQSSVLPSIQLNILEKHEMTLKDAKIGFSKELFPFGRCFKVIKPTLAEDAKIVGFLLAHKIEKNKTRAFSKFTVQFRDPSVKDIGQVRILQGLGTS